MDDINYTETLNIIYLYIGEQQILMEVLDKTTIRIFDVFVFILLQDCLTHNLNINLYKQSYLKL